MHIMNVFMKDLIRRDFCHVGTSRFDVLQNQTNVWVGDALDNRIWNFNLNDIIIIILSRAYSYVY